MDTRKVFYEECAKLGVMVSPYSVTTLTQIFFFSLWLHPRKNVSNHYLELFLTEKINVWHKAKFFGGWKTFCD